MTAVLRVTDRDRGWRELRRKAAVLNGKAVLVGVQGAKANAPHPGSKKLTVGDVAAINEYGAEVKMPGGKVVIIPERSFIRATFDEHAADISRRATLLGRAVLLTKITPDQASELLGMYIVGLMQQRIADGVPPPNAPSTIKRKKSSKPLIGVHNTLRASITHEIEG